MEFIKLFVGKNVSNLDIILYIVHAEAHYADVSCQIPLPQELADYAR
jgi:hypothetical protein